MIQIFCLGFSSLILIITGRLVISAIALGDKKVQQSGLVGFAFILFMVVWGVFFIALH